jgi:hypothetical protein
MKNFVNRIFIILIFFSLFSCSTIKYEAREDNQESELLDSYLGEILSTDYALSSAGKIYLYDSLFVLTESLSKWVKTNIYYYPDTSIASSIANLSRKTSKSIPINFRQLISIHKYKIYQMNLFYKQNTQKFDNKLLRVIKGTMPISYKDRVFYMSLPAISDDGSYLSFIGNYVGDPYSQFNEYSNRIFILKRNKTKWHLYKQIFDEGNLPQN